MVLDRNFYRCSFKIQFFDTCFLFIVLAVTNSTHAGPTARVEASDQVEIAAAVKPHAGSCHLLMDTKSEQHVENKKVVNPCSEDSFGEVFGHDIAQSSLDLKPMKFSTNGHGLELFK